MKKGFWKSRAWTAVAAALLGWTGAAQAQAPTPPPTEVEELRNRLDRLEKQNQDLMKLLQNQQNQPRQPVSLEEGGDPTAPPSLKAKQEIAKMVQDALKKEDTDKKKQQDAEGFTVGKDLGMRAYWNHGFWAETADKAFKVHVGGRTQYDMVGTAADQSVQFGTGGIGPYEGGVNFRRARLAVEGTLWEVFNFNCEYDFLNTFQTGTPATNVNTVENTPVPTDLWIEATHLPIIGNFRVGNQKPPIGFEHMTSSRFLNFMERSYGFDAFLENGNNGFTQGVQAFNYLTSDERSTGAVGLFKTTRNIFGWNPGSGEYGVTGRLTWLPYYQDNGRCLVHLGLGAEYRRLDDNIVRFRSRTLMRQAPAVLHNVVALARLQAEDQLLINPEFVVQMGPFLLQAEYQFTQVNGVQLITNSPTQTNVKAASSTYQGQAAYCEMLYFLTGENRAYNKLQPGFGRVVPYRNAFMARGDDGCIVTSCGAWQVGARYSWIDLNDNNVFGGEINSITLGLNWFLNPNFKIQANYEMAHREIQNGTGSGNYQGFGVRFAFDF